MVYIERKKKMKGSRLFQDRLATLYINRSGELIIIFKRKSALLFFIYFFEKKNKIYERISMMLCLNLDLVMNKKIFIYV